MTLPEQLMALYNDAKTEDQVTYQLRLNRVQMFTLMASAQALIQACGMLRTIRDTRADGNAAALADEGLKGIDA